MSKITPLFVIPFAGILLIGCGKEQPAAKSTEQTTTKSAEQTISMNPTDNAEDRAVEAVKKLGGNALRENKDPAKPVVFVYSATPR